MGREISSILIANRGEIALRIIRASRELGIKTIAVYSNEDTRSVHVKRADEAYHIGLSTATESYLNTKKIIETAMMAGADAIHPGYGFLSEDENFADTCEKKGIIFIGPSSRSMAVTGDKMKEAIKAVLPRCAEMMAMHWRRFSCHSSLVTRHSLLHRQDSVGTKVRILHADKILDLRKLLPSQQLFDFLFV